MAPISQPTFELPIYNQALCRQGQLEKTKVSWLIVGLVNAVVRISNRNHPWLTLLGLLVTVAIATFKNCHELFVRIQYVI
jgi:hypothetical protein